MPLSAPKANLNILGIESSCDDAAASIYSSGQKKLLSNVVSSQIKVHNPFGGVVPELASREHFKNIPLVVDQALQEAGLDVDDIDLISVTHAPGLIGSLLVGLAYAKGLAFSKNIPFIGVHHIEAHMLAIHIEKKIPFPYVALVVSGGHTHLYVIHDVGEYELVGATCDDAAGEVFDKVGKIFNLGFPGGPVIDRLSKKGNPKAISFPRAFIKDEQFRFSFSGLKTAVSYYIQKNPHYNINDVLASFQEAVVDVLVHKALKLALKRNISNVVVCGGVACNSRLRERMDEVLSVHKINFSVPTPKLCADNAAMIAYTGWELWKKGRQDNFDLNAFPNKVL
ncbi:MAG: tRNA (adenosine(37)-N6)-threonylcarbamoyltransferase complex transferase subunit TsaD [Deltaproteobacteria bacterium]|nr:tRNA (adenosine(37)-N6)-threonylcarbamoyltransferase complex transferase subunit TsaD [Deltaproteobacteria bacterium]